MRNVKPLHVFFMISSLLLASGLFGIMCAVRTSEFVWAHYYYKREELENLEFCRNLEFGKDGFCPVADPGYSSCKMSYINSSEIMA